MLTINSIVEEMKGVPSSRLEELYQFVKSLKPKSNITDNTKQKILAYGGLLSEMDTKDYEDFSTNATETRKSLMDRKIDL
ncbi:MAG TPA: hypothetical protein VF273_06755 [Pelobium sp.]